jgi:hypothetical protein
VPLVGTFVDTGAAGAGDSAASVVADAMGAGTGDSVAPAAAFAVTLASVAFACGSTAAARWTKVRAIAADKPSLTKG